MSSAPFIMRDSGSVKLYGSLSSGLASAALLPSAAALSRARCSRTFLASLILASRVSRRCSSSGNSSPRWLPYWRSSASSAASAATSCRRNCSGGRSEEHTSELQSHLNLVFRLLLLKKKKESHNIEQWI